MLLTTIVFLLVLSALILVHELGHFLTAKKAGVRVEEFGLGYPPRLWAKKVGETVYSLNAIPFGGFVRLYGEELADQVKVNGQAFWSKSKTARIVVITAGVLANFLLAVVVFSVVYSFMGIPTVSDKAIIVGITPDSPAAQAGLQEGDVVLAVDGDSVTSLDHFIELIEAKKGEEVFLLVQRDGGEEGFFLTPRKEPPGEEGALGVIVSNLEMKQYPFWQMPFRGAKEGFREAFAWSGLILGSLRDMLVDLVGQGKVPQDVAGPIGIFQITGAVTQDGILAILQFAGILSVNLAILNILPFPALDGGKLAFVLYEAITKRRPKPSFERWVNAFGMAFLIGLLILVTLNDIKRLIITTNLLERLRSFSPF